MTNPDLAQAVSSAAQQLRLIRDRLRKPVRLAAAFDVTLMDANGQPATLFVSVERERPQTLHLSGEQRRFYANGEPIGENFNVAGGTPVDVSLEDGTALSIGLRPPTQATRRSRVIHSFGHVCAVLVLGMLLSGFLADFLFRQSSTSFVVQIANSGEITDRNMRSTLVSATDQVDANNLTDDVFLQINEAGNNLVATGTIPAKKAADWRAFLRWYDREHRAGTLVSHVEYETAAVALPDIAMVKFMGSPKIKLSNGTDFFVEDRLGPLELEAIEQDKLTFIRGNETLTVALDAQP